MRTVRVTKPPKTATPAEAHALAESQREAVSHIDGVASVQQKNQRGQKKLTDTSWWPWLKRCLTLAFFALVTWLVVSQARAVEWQQVLEAMRDYSTRALFSAVGLAAASYLLYSCFDLIGKLYTGHQLSKPVVMLVTAVSYAFNLNLGSWVGGIAFRYRLYSLLGLSNGAVTRVMSLSMLANWTGYMLLAGAVFAFQPPRLPEGWAISASGLRWVGLGLLLTATAYAGLCALSKTRSFNVRGHTIELPSLPMALVQMAMGASNWLLMSGIIFVLLQHQIQFTAVISVLLLAAVAGVITHVPANLGVLEAVFVALLSHVVAAPELLAALVVYRLLYFLIPLVLAGAAFLALELHVRRLQNKATQLSQT